MSGAKTGVRPDGETASEASLVESHHQAAVHALRAVDIAMSAVDRGLAHAAAQRERIAQREKIFDGLRFDVSACGSRLVHSIEGKIEACALSPAQAPAILRHAAALIDQLMNFAVLADEDPLFSAGSNPAGRAEAMRLRDEIVGMLEREGVTIAQHEHASRALKAAASELEGC